jgi:acyl-coenzyme A thioesterase PaaI-like protein
VPRVTERREIQAHHDHCFGCGPENPAALGLQFSQVGDRVNARVRLSLQHQGAPGFAHGGVLAAALDDTLGTLLLLLRRPAVTAKLEVNYRRPAFVERDYVLEAWTERIDGRKLHLAAELREPDGEVVADATALFLVVELEHFRQSGRDMPELVKEQWREHPELPY